MHKNRTLHWMTVGVGLLLAAACGTGTSPANTAVVHDAAGSDAVADVVQAKDAGVSGDMAAATGDAAAAPQDVQAMDATGVDAASADAQADADANTGKDAGPAAGYAGGPVELADLASATAAEMCKANFTTCTPAEKQPFATQQGCFAAVYAADATDFAELAAKVKSGALKYDAAHAGECLALATAHCDDLDFVDGPAVCQTVFVGALPEGAPCTFNVECKSDFCFGESDCQGKCKKRKALGASCADSDKCVAGALCFGGKCVANVPVGVGGACGLLACKDGLYCDGKGVCAGLHKNGGTCDIPGSCVAGSQCWDPGSGPVCMALPKQGEGCYADVFADASALCAAGLVCTDDGSAETGVCELKAGLGQPCVNTSYCGGWDVHCVGAAGNKTCQLLSSKGGPCQAGDLAQGEWGGCLEPYTCRKGVCIEPPGLGEPCADDLLKACAADLDCDPLTNVCIAEPGAGEKCYGLCKSGYTCDQPGTDPGTCKPAACP